MYRWVINAGLIQKSQYDDAQMCTEFGDASFLNPSSVARKAVHSLQDWAILNEMVQRKCEGEHDKFTGYGT